ncbi:MAG: RNA pseudouridine synthase [Planctomycetales bacterium]|nr:RNA pseudouridine synthase [Planctomycetales bacterium]
MPKNMTVLYEDNHLLVVNKPTGLATMGTTEQPSAYGLAAEYLKVKYRKPGNVFVGIVSRLDKLVSGVLVLARTSKAAARLSEQIRNQQVDKRYWAVVEGNCHHSAWYTLENWIRKDDASQRMVCAANQSPTAQLAALRLRTLKYDQHCSWLEVQLLTGRKHQIRIQLAELGFPIVGDRKYGSTVSFPMGIALHCHQVTVSHPTKKETMSFQCFPPKSWMRWRKTLNIELQ